MLKVCIPTKLFHPTLQKSKPWFNFQNFFFFKGQLHFKILQPIARCVYEAFSNLILSSEEFPPAWKMAIVKPLHKNVLTALFKTIDSSLITLFKTVDSSRWKMFILKHHFTLHCLSRISNSNCSESQMKTCTVTWGHCDADATMAVPEAY